MRLIPVPTWVQAYVGMSVRIIETDERAPDLNSEAHVGWGEEERAAEYERKHGFVRARLALLATEEGGRMRPILSGYRPQWDLGHRTETGAIAYSDAEVWIEGMGTLEPGAERMVRLHPFFPEYWRDVAPGAVLDMYEGNRRLGQAHVVEVVRTD